MKRKLSSTRQAIDTHPGLKDALCALSFYRQRHSRRPQYKHATGRRAARTLSVYVEYTARTKQFIRKARTAGFRGSIRQKLGIAS